MTLSMVIREAEQSRAPCSETLATVNSFNSPHVLHLMEIIGSGSTKATAAAAVTQVFLCSAVWW